MVNHKTAILRGLLYGLFMFIMMGILYPLAMHEKLNLGHLAVNFLIWMAVGLLITLSGIFFHSVTLEA